MAKKKKSKKEKVNYKKIGNSYVSDGSSYRNMFKKASGKLKIIEFELSKKKTFKIKIKYDKKKRQIVYLDPFVLETGRGAGISYISDPVSFIRILWDTIRREKLEKKLSGKKKNNLEKFLQEFYKLEAKFIEQLQTLDFLFNKSKFERKIRGELSKNKASKKSRKSKKSNNK